MSVPHERSQTTRSIAVLEEQLLQLQASDADSDVVEILVLEALLDEAGEHVRELNSLAAFAVQRGGGQFGLDATGEPKLDL